MGKETEGKLGALTTKIIRVNEVHYKRLTKIEDVFSPSTLDTRELYWYICENYFSL